MVRAAGLEQLVGSGGVRVETVELDLPALVGALRRAGCTTAGVPVTPERSARFAAGARRWCGRSRAGACTGRRARCSSPTPRRCGRSTPCSPRCSARASTSPSAAPEDERRRDARPARRAAGARAGPPAAPPRAGGAATAAIAPASADAATASSPCRWRRATRSGCAASASTRSSRASCAQLYRLMTRLRLATPTRRTRRAERDRRGEHIDLRRTLRGSLRTGGDPIRLARRRRRVVRRRLVLLCDISRLDGALRARLPAVPHVRDERGPDAEAFVFATRLTRVTRALATRSPERAIQRAAAAAPDWSSGTRIGDALRAFNDRHGRRGMARGAVIVILSDGWERGEPALVGPRDGAARAARVPDRVGQPARQRAPGSSPRAGGMAAALPHFDALVSGHSLDALGEVADAIAAGAARRAARRRPRRSRSPRSRGRARRRWPAARWRCRAATARAAAGRRRDGS